MRVEREEVPRCAVDKNVDARAQKFSDSMKKARPRHVRRIFMFIIAYISQPLRTKSELFCKSGEHPDDVLVKIMLDATDSAAGKPGARGFPPCLKGQTIELMELARGWKAPTLNEFRKHLGLARSCSLVMSCLII